MKKLIIFLVALIVMSFNPGITAIADCDSNQIEQELYSATTASSSDSSTTDIEYKEKSVLQHNLALQIPTYVLAGVSCVPNAGTCILGYYDFTYPDLIPNFTAGRLLNGKYYFNLADSYVVDAAVILAQDMGLSNPTDAATVNQFKSGIKTYCQRKGLNVTLYDCATNKFNYALTKQYLDQNIPVIIFASEFSLSFINTLTERDQIVSYNYSENHAMAVFGYKEITYTLTSGQQITNRYLYVSAGFVKYPTALVNVDSNITIDDAYSVMIK